MLRNTLIREIMTREPVSIRVDEPFAHAEEKMRLHHIRHLPVVDEHCVLVGLFTQRDLFRAVSPHQTEVGYRYDEHQLGSFILSHFMTPEPFSLHANDSAMVCVEAMVIKKFGCIPIVDDEKHLIGIVTQIDVLRFIARHF